MGVMLMVEGHRLIYFEVSIEAERLNAYEKQLLALMLRTKA